MFLNYHNTLQLVHNMNSELLQYLNTVSLVVSISSGLGATVLVLIIAIVIVVIFYVYCHRHFVVKKGLYR